MFVTNWFRRRAEKDHRDDRRARFAALQWTNPAFKNILEKWEEAERHMAHLSSPWHIKHPLFAETVAMGQPIIPFLLIELARNPRFWMLSVLREISKENPISPEHRGMFGKMTDDWLRWGEENGHLPAD